MFAIDTSAFIAFMESDSAEPDPIASGLVNGSLMLPPVVLAELLSAPKLDDATRNWISDLPVLELKTGFWQRVGAARCTLITQKLKSALGDAMIAQCCIDHNLPLLTHDKDFRHYAKHLGLKLLGEAA